VEREMPVNQCRNTGIVGSAAAFGDGKHGTNPGDAG
jgi:hypothetical protein